MVTAAFAQKAHVFPDGTRVNRQDHLEIGGCDTVELAREFGTPLYVFDEETLRRRSHEYRDAFRAQHPNSEVIYACKAYINPALARLFQEAGLGLDVVSGGELAVAQAVRFPADRIYFHGNNKGKQELESALGYGIARVVVDSFQELQLLEGLAAALKTRPKIMLRIGPGVDPHTHVHTTTGVLDSKFGFPVATGQAREAVAAALKSRHLELTGLHFHLGSPIFELEPYAVATKIALEFAASVMSLGLKLQDFSPGGGFAIAYLQDQRPPAPADYAKTIVGAIQEGCAAHGLPLPRLIVEPGRAIVGPACVALYSVGGIKEIPGVRKYVAVDGGMGDNIRPALYDAKYEAVAANKLGEELAERVTIAGKFCESGDILVKDALLPRLVAGDIVALPASGAYCPSMASTYNLNGRPAIVLVKGGKARLIRRRETPADMMVCDVV